MISEESNIFGDLLQDDFVDSYNNLTLKTVHMLRHFKFEQHKHFLKTDDDSFVGIGKERLDNSASLHTLFSDGHTILDKKLSRADLNALNALRRTNIV